MQVVDSRGRVFGLINIIDLGVLVMLALLGVGFLTVLQQRETPELAESSRRVAVTLQLRHPDIAQMIAVGDQEFRDGTPIATVTEVEMNREGDAMRVLVDATLTTKEDAGTYTYRNRFGTQYLKAGEMFSLDLEKLRVDGLIVALTVI